MIGRKKLFIMFTIFLMLVLVSSIFGISNYKPKYGITNTKVNFRSGATTSSAVISTLTKNTRLKMVGEINDFYIVQLESNKVGLVSKKYITTTIVKPKTIDYTSVTKYSATIKNNGTNVRRGPSTNFSKITSLKKGVKVTVIGKINNFSMVVYDDNKIGMIEASLIEKTGSSTVKPPSNNNLSNRDLLLKYINDVRKSNSLPILSVDIKLQEISLLKSNEMVNKNYFSHTSPTYGTPFTMMKNFGITYKSAGENIAANNDMKKIFDSWMSSDAHKKNILSSNYNYIGIGVTKSDVYGFIAVTMFIGK